MSTFHLHPSWVLTTTKMYHILSDLINLQSTCYLEYIFRNKVPAIKFDEVLSTFVSD